MSDVIPINLVVEDSLSEAVLRKILEYRVRFAVGVCYGGHGYGYIKQRLGGFNNAAKGMPHLILADLEMPCAPRQIRSWLSTQMHPNLLFRIAAKEVESWLLADSLGIASFLGIREKLIPQNADEISDPKQFLINLARKSPRRKLREDIVPRPGSTAQVGPDYNGQLSSFVANIWDVQKAANNSPSLCRCLKAVDNFQPSWPLSRSNSSAR